MPEPVAMERNFEEYPFCELGRRSKTVGEPLFFSRTIPGEMELDQGWRLRVSGELGRPAAAEQDFYVAVMVLLHRSGGMPESRELDLSIYEIARLCGYSRRQKDYDYIKEGLRRIESTHAESSQAFWSESRQVYLNRSVNPWNTHFRDYKEVRGNRAWRTGRHTLSFTTAFAKSIEEGYVSYLDADFFFSLSLPSSKRLTRLLSSCASSSLSGPRWEVEITQLRDQFPLSKNYIYRSKIEEKLSPAHEELRAASYLSDFSIERREDGLYACYDVNPRFTQLRDDQVLETTATNRPALEMMAAAKVPREIRLSSIREYGPELCLEFAVLLPHQKWAKEPVAAFRAALKNPEEHLPRWKRTADKLNRGAGNSSTERVLPADRGWSPAR